MSLFSRVTAVGKSKGLVKGIEVKLDTLDTVDVIDIVSDSGRCVKLDFTLAYVDFQR